MEPETIEKIKSWQGINEESAKLIFIRQSATKAFENGEILENTKTLVKTLVEISLASNMSKDDIATHIGNLERVRAYLASFTQGLQIGYANEVEPKIRAKREKERQERIANKLSGDDKKVNDLIALARGLADGSIKPKEAIATETAETKPPIPNLKVVCPSCSKQTFSLKFHKC